MSKAILKRGESLVVHASVKNHFKRQLYYRDAQSIKEYLRNFEKTSIKHFLPISEPHLLDYDAITRLTRKYQILSFPSPFKPLEPFDRDYEEVLQRTKVHFFPFNGRKRKNRSLIYFHGWGRPNFEIEKRFQFPIFQYTYKADIFAVELPYHLSRNPRGFSGQGFMDGDPVRTIEGFRQATSEGIALYKILRTGYEEVGLCGVSLGGHIVTMLTLLIKGTQFSLACLVGTPIRDNLVQLSISPNLVHSMKSKIVLETLSILDFSKIKPRNSKNRNFYLFGGKFDSIILPKTVLRLGKHLQANTYFVPTGHFTFPIALPYICTRIAKWNRESPE